MQNTTNTQGQGQNSAQGLATEIKDALSNPKTQKPVLATLLEKAGALLTAKAEGKIDLTGEADAKRIAEAIASAKGIADGSIATRFAELGDVVSQALSKTGHDLGLLAKEFTDLTTARDALSAEVTELTKINAATLTLAQVLNAQAESVAEHDATMATKKAELEKAIADADAYVTEKHAEITQKIKDMEAEAEAERKKKQAEWDYDFGRKKQADSDALTDQLAQQRKAHQATVDAETKALDEREEELDKREEALDDKAEYIKELEDHKAGFNSAVEAKVKEKVETVTESLTKDHNNAVELLEARNASKVEVLENTVKSQTQQIEELKAALKEAQSNTADAVEKVKDIALSAVEGASKTQSVVNVQGAGEQARK